MQTQNTKQKIENKHRKQLKSTVYNMGLYHDFVVEN